jgi:hypothetical protein
MKTFTQIKISRFKQRVSLNSSFGRFLTFIFLTPIVAPSIFAAEFQSPGPIVTGALAGFQRVEGELAPVSKSPFLQISAGRNCSATYISNSGYLLTALHCVTECLRAGGLHNNFNKGAIRLEQKITERSGEITLGHIDLKKAQSLTCPVEGISKKKSNGDWIFAPSGIGLKVVLLGSDKYIDGPSLAGLEEHDFRDLIAKGYNGFASVGDFAILKVVPIPSKALAEGPGLSQGMSLPGKCLPLGRGVAAAGKEIGNVSFPYLSRKGRPASPYLPMVTRGELLAPGANPSPDLEHLPVYLPGLQLLSIDAWDGASGSSYFDKNAQIDGIVVATRISSNEVYEEGLTLGISSEVVRAKVLKDLPHAIAKEILEGCRPGNLEKQMVNEVLP